MSSKLKTLNKNEAGDVNKKGYNTWSEFYDSYPNPTVAIDELSFPSVYTHVQEQNVLEVGCGTGRHTKRLIESENRVTGVDISEGMLMQLRKKIVSPRLHLVNGDFLNVSVPNAPFDSILLSLVLEHISDLAAFFSKAREALKKGGHLYISEIHPRRTAAGVFAHFKNPDGSEVHLRSSPHSSEDISHAAAHNDFVVKELISVNGSSELAALNPKWEKYLNQPMIQIWVFALK